MDNTEIGSFFNQDINSLYLTLLNQGLVSEESALKVGCIVEVTDIRDLEKETNLPEDINTVYKSLDNGSYSHYKAFDSKLKEL